MMLLAFFKSACSKNTLFRAFPFFLSICVVLVLLQSQIDNIRPKNSAMEDMKYLPSGQFLKGAALAYDGLLADFLWIKAIVYFGEHYQNDKTYIWLYHLLDIVVTLDPHFQYAYEFGGVALAYWAKDINVSIEFLKRGLENVDPSHKRYWTIPYFLGFNYMYYKKDYAVAARYLEEATKYPGHPRYLPMLVSRLYTNAKDPDIAITFLNEIYNSTENIQVKKDLEKRIKEVIVERDIQILEQARDRYKKQTGLYPSKLEDLVTAGFLKEIPREPFSGKYIIKEDNSIFSSIIKKRMGVYIN